MSISKQIARAAGQPGSRQSEPVHAPAKAVAHDARPQAAALLQQQTMLNQGPRALQLRALRTMMASSPQTPQLRATRDMMSAASSGAGTGIGTGIRTGTRAGSDAGPAKRGGLPAALQAGVESLSGMNMSHVRVHYNSSRPAQLNAHAYAQGSAIHVAPGQERHLPHEAWHVVQQAQGRVHPTAQMKKGMAINDDPGLEHEADVMGAQALSAGLSARWHQTGAAGPRSPLRSGAPSSGSAQLSAVTELGVHNDAKKTQDKKVKMAAQGSEAWFRFGINGNVIDSFANNVTSSTPKGNAHVDTSKNVDLSNDDIIGEENIGGLSRPRHFSAGDRVAKITADIRKGKWTWHHKQAPYKMELVDMAVHKSFGHHGGFSAWQEDT